MMEDGGTQNYLISVSDLMSGLIFIFIITLMIFVVLFQQATESIQSAEATRKELLETLQDELETRGLNVTIDTLQGILRLTERSINFPRARAEPEPAHLPRVRVLADVLSDVLPCFVVRSPAPCRHDIDRIKYAASVHLLMIEGHTDAVPVGERLRFRDNLELSGGRAASIHRLLVDAAPVLSELRNRDASQILSISGYGAQNLLIPDDPFAPGNRRIDLRFLMEAPSSSSPAAPGVTREVEGELEQAPLQ